jgi:hypothetical protein
VVCVELWRSLRDDGIQVAALNNARFFKLRF